MVPFPLFHFLWLKSWFPCAWVLFHSCGHGTLEWTTTDLPSPSGIWWQFFLQTTEHLQYLFEDTQAIVWDSLIVRHIYQSVKRVFLMWSHADRTFRMIEFKIDDKLKGFVRGICTLHYHENDLKTTWNPQLDGKHTSNALHRLTWVRSNTRSRHTSRGISWVSRYSYEILNVRPSLQQTPTNKVWGVVKFFVSIFFFWVWTSDTGEQRTVRPVFQNTHTVKLEQYQNY